MDRTEARIPDDIAFMTKPDLALCESPLDGALPT